jgi:cellulose synthase/poly-beta-1,6-N-acetylglucosamine synthase-like glycosyltransferase
VSPAVSSQVLCFELLAKKNRTWTLHYTTGAVAETDVPEHLLELIKQVRWCDTRASSDVGAPRTLRAPFPRSRCTTLKRSLAALLPLHVLQRRRWLNGSFFSLIYYVAKFHKLLDRSDHSWFRRLGLMVQFFYQASALLLSWFGIGSLYLSLVVIFQLALEAVDLQSNTEIMWVFSLCYGFLTFLQVRRVARCNCAFLTAMAAAQSRVRCARRDGVRSSGSDSDARLSCWLRATRYCLGLAPSHTRSSRSTSSRRWCSASS